MNERNFSCLEIAGKHTDGVSTAFFVPTELFERCDITPTSGVISMTKKSGDEVKIKGTDDILILYPEIGSEQITREASTLRIAVRNRKLICSVFSTWRVLQPKEDYRSEISQIMGISEPVFIEIPDCEIRVVELPPAVLHLIFSDLPNKDEHLEQKQAFQIELGDKVFQFITDEEQGFWKKGQLVERRAGAFTPLLESVYFMALSENQALIATNFDRPLLGVFPGNCKVISMEKLPELNLPAGYKTYTLDGVKIKPGYISREAHRQAINRFLSSM